MDGIIWQLCVDTVTMARAQRYTQSASGTHSMEGERSWNRDTGKKYLFGLLKYGRHHLAAVCGHGDNGKSPEIYSVS